MTALDANDVARARGPEGLREVWDTTPVQGQYGKSTRFQLVPFNGSQLGHSGAISSKGSFPIPAYP